VDNSSQNSCKSEVGFHYTYHLGNFCTVSTFHHVGLYEEHSRRYQNINLMCRNELSFLILAIVYI